LQETLQVHYRLFSQLASQLEVVLLPGLFRQRNQVPV